MAFLASPSLLRHRLLGPAIVTVVALVVCVIAGVRGFSTLMAFALLVRSQPARRCDSSGSRSGQRGCRGLTGSSGGGMVVHLGVVLIAVGFAASHSFAQTTQLSLAQGQTAAFDGHTFTYLGTSEFATSTHTGLQADVRIDGGQVYTPAVSDYPFASEAIGTPSVKSGPFEDVYLTFASTPAKPGGPAGILVIVEPLVSWIWFGGFVMLAGTALAVWPRRRARSGRVRTTSVTAGAASIAGEVDLDVQTVLAGGDGDEAAEPNVVAGTPK